MYAVLLTLGALAGMASAWAYPECEQDNCYRNLINPLYTDVIGPFCMGYLAPTATASAAVPTDYSNCASPSELSSACSCITYTYTQTQSSSTPPPTTSSTVATTSTASGNVVSTSSVYSSTSSSYSVPTSTSNSSQQLTTSTVYTTTTYTVSSCAPTVTNCPYGHVTTDTIVLSVTVCPVTESSTAPATSTSAAALVTAVGTVSKAVGTVGSSKTTSSIGLQVTGAAGHVNAAFELAAAAAGLIGAALL